jgi:hypothetical protein
MGAQGMNTGLQDAHNLAWKLALVVQGHADAVLLDTYESERLPVAQRLLRTTDRAFQFIVSESWLTGLLRTKVIARMAAFAMTKESVRKFAFRADWYSVPHESAVADLARPAQERAGCRRPIPLAAAVATRRCAGRGSLREAR